ncbi:prepilin-type N-terminal cleavage/methylation domain-containing protein [Vibrio sp. ZSDZ34]|jgi:type IV pilus assembly protein PilE|uniref:Prepilin-type N-terminal cleavage/methylation domain-containing protein n=1 Tax=Vibrio gelatinilyticus TaxID=2893468 RepID=A0A9X2B053_9VIBR|nr:type IV pilin protein [Vibrio gelatinilyticus]MCJ2378432.1 prepilin-type N-terminal cleavage/methylation domain-containing protein [Vibrio gelatinilyticus]
MICNKRSSRQIGLTLIEIVISLAILSLFVSIAYPVYKQQVLGSHRTAALTDLMRMQLELEKEFNGSYQFESVISAGQCVLCESDPSRYQFTVTADNGYTLSATPAKGSPQLEDSCLNSDKRITLDAIGNMLPASCWK